MNSNPAPYLDLQHHTNPSTSHIIHTRDASNDFCPSELTPQYCAPSPLVAQTTNHYQHRSQDSFLAHAISYSKASGPSKSDFDSIDSTFHDFTPPPLPALETSIGSIPHPNLSLPHTLLPYDLPHFISHNNVPHFPYRNTVSYGPLQHSSKCSLPLQMHSFNPSYPSLYSQVPYGPRLHPFPRLSGGRSDSYPPSHLHQISHQPSMLSNPSNPPNDHSATLCPITPTQLSEMSFERDYWRGKAYQYKSELSQSKQRNNDLVQRIKRMERRSADAINLSEDLVGKLGATKAQRDSAIDNLKEVNEELTAVCLRGEKLHDGVVSLEKKNISLKRDVQVLNSFQQELFHCLQQYGVIGSLMAYSLGFRIKPILIKRPDQDHDATGLLNGLTLNNTSINLTLPWDNVASRYNPSEIDVIGLECTIFNHTLERNISFRLLREEHQGISRNASEHFVGFTPNKPTPVSSVPFTHITPTISINSHISNLYVATTPHTPKLSKESQRLVKSKLDKQLLSSSHPNPFLSQLPPTSTSKTPISSLSSSSITSVNPTQPAAISQSFSPPTVFQTVPINPQIPSNSKETTQLSDILSFPFPDIPWDHITNSHAQTVLWQYQPISIKLPPDAQMNQLNIYTPIALESKELNPFLSLLLGLVHGAELNVKPQFSFVKVQQPPIDLNNNHKTSKKYLYTNQTINQLNTGPDTNTEFLPGRASKKQRSKPLKRGSTWVDFTNDRDPQYSQLFDESCAEYINMSENMARFDDYLHLFENKPSDSHIPFNSHDLQSSALSSASSSPLSSLSSASSPSSSPSSASSSSLSQACTSDESFTK